jgi:hypothetical protein
LETSPSRRTLIPKRLGDISFPTIPHLQTAWRHLLPDDPSSPNGLETSPSRRSLISKRLGGISFPRIPPNGLETSPPRIPHLQRLRRALPSTGAERRSEINWKTKELDTFFTGVPEMAGMLGFKRRTRGRRGCGKKVLRHMVEWF